MPPTVKWPNENTAFLVIHGNGPHREYETLNKFASKFFDALKNDGVALKAVEHKLDDRTGSYVRFTSPDHEPYIDFHEYYWDCHMVREITAKELGDWLKELDNGVDAFRKKGPIKKCRINRCLIKKYLILVRKGRIKKRLIKKCLKKCLIRSNYNPPLFTLFRILGPFPLLRIILGMRNFLPEVISDRILKAIKGFATDTAIFCLHDQRSSYYEIREKVLNGAVDELEALLKDSAYYQQIIVVGHSLGAVIAYDAFNRIARDMIVPNPKFKGWVTFGSFLDVVAFFFQAHVPGSDKPRGIKAWLAKIKGWVPFNSCLDVVALFFQVYMLSHIKRMLPCLFRKKGTVPPCQINMEKQITDQRHAFKKKLPAYGHNPVNYGLLNNVKWLNFYHPDDFISNCELIAYEFDPEVGDAQVKCDTPIKAGCCKSLLYKIPIIKWFTKSMDAHNSYWTNDEMYLKIARTFF